MAQPDSLKHCPLPSFSWLDLFLDHIWGEKAPLLCIFRESIYAPQLLCDLALENPLQLLKLLQP